MTRVHSEYVGSVTDTEALRHIFRDPDGPVGQDLDNRSRRVLERARATVPVRTGRLRTTLRREHGQAVLGPYHDVVAGFQGTTPYLGYVLFGAEPHIIRPTRAKALRFRAGGKIVFSQKVSHPGNRADNFLLRALNAAT